MRIRYLYCIIFSSIFSGNIDDTRAQDATSSCYGGNFTRHVSISGDGNDGELFFVLDVACDKFSSWVGFPGGDKTGTVKGDFSALKAGSTVDYGEGWRAEIRIGTSRIEDFEVERADVRLTRDGEPYAAFQSVSNSFFSITKPCSFMHGEGNFHTEIVEVDYQSEQVPNLLSLSERHGWEALVWGASESETIRGNYLIADPMRCGEDGNCWIVLDVGFGHEFYAASLINKIPGDICASRVRAEAGSPPRMVILPFPTLSNHGSDTAAVLQEKVVGGLFDGRVKLSSLRQHGRGNVYAFSLLGPNASLGVDFAPGYWYSANIALGVGIETFTGDIGESLLISLLDMRKISAPENLLELPAGIISTGQVMEYLDPVSGELTEDGLKMDEWAAALGTKVAADLGGRLLDH
ncbi:MAG: hypothetical protein KF723_00505 [Rhizobiaceae bacterium]|nr:hypothetical protein [Rhizobiaceae bacterium]